MAGINRLGKAAPRPGSLRPPDPTRHRITDHFSENVEGLESDRDYQRAVQDIEDAQQTQGWLFGRGAFDKTDLLYLRDQEEKSRHTEIELHDREVQQYAKLRAQTDKQKPGGVLGSSSLSVTKKIEKEKIRPLPKALQRIVKVGRTSGPPPAAAAQPAAQAAQSGAAAPSAPAPAPAAAAQEAGPSSGSAGLGALLGAYGSGSDSEGEDAPVSTAARGTSAPAAAPIPEAAAAAAAAKAPQAAAAAPAAGQGAGRGGGHVRSKSRSPAAEQHDAEEELDYGT